MTWGAVATAGASLVGGVISGNAARDAANTSADAQLRAAQIAADAARFRPVGITTRYGSSNFQFDGQGNLSGAGYNVSPELQAYQNRLQGLTGGALTQAEQAQQQYAPLSTAATGLFGLGQQYLAQSPQEVAAKYMAQQQDLLAPSRERSMAMLQNQLYQQGRGGLAVGATSARPSGAAGFGAASPEMEAYYNAMAQQDAQLAAQSQQAGQQNVAFGTGLLSQGSGLLGQYQAGQVSALNPFTSYLGAGQTLESMGQQPLTLGAGLGGQAAAYGANAGADLLRGGMNAALTQQQANSYSPFGSVLLGAASNPALGQGVSNWWQNRTPNTARATGGAAGYNIPQSSWENYYGSNQ